MLLASRRALPFAHGLSLAIADASPLTKAAFIEDSNATSISLNRDVRQFAGQNEREQWSQGSCQPLQRQRRVAGQLHADQRFRQRRQARYERNIVGYTLPIR